MKTANSCVESPADKAILLLATLALTSCVTTQVAPLARLNITQGAAVCLRTSSSPSTYANVLLPITLIATGYHFYLDPVSCPNAEELAKTRMCPSPICRPQPETTTGR